MELVLDSHGLEFDVIVRPQHRMTDDEYFDFCQANPDIRFERNADGEIEIVPPCGLATSARNSNIDTSLNAWNRRKKRGIVFDSNGQFILSNGAARSPDASWVERSRWDALTEEQKEKFAPLCPDFVIELRSPSDRMQRLHSKMQEYIENGAKLGWLIDPKSRTVYVYRPGRDPEKLVDAERIEGAGPLEGFNLNLKRVV